MRNESDVFMRIPIVVAFSIRTGLESVSAGGINLDEVTMSVLSLAMRL